MGYEDLISEDLYYEGVYYEGVYVEDLYYEDLYYEGVYVEAAGAEGPHFEILRFRAACVEDLCYEARYDADPRGILEDERLALHVAYTESQSSGASQYHCRWICS